MSAIASEIFTVGHSTRSFTQLVPLLQRHEIALLVDVRSVPTSRRMPHFAKQALEQSLPHEGIEYVHLKQLGGFRRPARGSPNTGWRNKGFQGYADYMRTPEFESALERLEALATARRAAVMCAEALWWRCHRMLISDALSVRGWRVRHVGTSGVPADHVLTSFAVVEGRTLTYPPLQRSRLRHTGHFVRGS